MRLCRRSRVAGLGNWAWVVPCVRRNYPFSNAWCSLGRVIWGRANKLRGKAEFNDELFSTFSLSTDLTLTIPQVAIMFKAAVTVLLLLIALAIGQHCSDPNLSLPIPACTVSLKCLRSFHMLTVPRGSVSRARQSNTSAQMTLSVSVVSMIV